MTAPVLDGRRRVGLNTSLIVACQSFQMLVNGGIALFLPLIRADLGLTFAQGGMLAAAGQITYAAMQIPSGWIADRFNPKRVFAIGLLGVNILALGFALLHAYPLLLANQAVAGIFRALVFTPGMLLITRQFRPERRATAMGLYVAGGFSSNVLLNLVGPVLVGPLGWRMLFAIFSVLGLVTVALFARLGDSVPRTGTGPANIMANLRAALAHKVVWLAGVIQFVRYSVAFGVATWLPSFIHDEKGFSLRAAGLAVAIGAAITAPSNIVGGWLSDRLGRPLLVIGASLSVLAATLLILPRANSLGAIIAVVAVNSAFVQIYFGPLFALPLAYIGQANAGLVSGFGNFCANLGAFAFAYGLGAVKDATGAFDVGWWALAGLCVIGLGAVWAIARLPKPGPA
jgi:nitrate/nitrite transporter NarK